LAAAIFVAGCGSVENQTASRAGSGATIVAIRAAVNDNARLYAYVLWNNRIPSWASRSTTAQALDGSADDAAWRRRRRLRIRLSAPVLRIRLIRMNASRTEATVAVFDHAKYRICSAGHGCEHQRIVDWHVRMRLVRSDRRSPFRVANVVSTATSVLP